MQDLIVEALSLCIEGSRAADLLREPRRRAALDQVVRQSLTAAGLDLNAVWTGLLKEPGLTERSLGSVFVAIEEVSDILGVRVVPVQRLQALNAQQRQQLRAECAVGRAHIEQLARQMQPAAADPFGLSLSTTPAPAFAPAAADSEAEKAARARAARALMQQAGGGPPVQEEPVQERAAPKAREPQKAAPKTQPVRAKEATPQDRKRRLVAAVSVGVAVVSLLVSVMLNAAKPSRYDMSFVTTLELSDGLREKDVVQGIISDKRWAEMPLEARQAAGKSVFQSFRSRGVRQIALQASDGGIGINATDRNGELKIDVMPPPTPPVARSASAGVPGAPGAPPPPGAAPAAPAMPPPAP